MLRLSAIFAHEKGINVCALIHDAILIEAPIDLIEEHTLLAQEAMAEASAVVLDGFRLQSDSKIFRYPNRYYEKKGVAFWNTVRECLDKIKGHGSNGDSDPTNNEQVVFQSKPPALSP